MRRLVGLFAAILFISLVFGIPLAYAQDEDTSPRPGKQEEMRVPATVTITVTETRTVYGAAPGGSCEGPSLLAIVLAAVIYFSGLIAAAVIARG